VAARFKLVVGLGNPTTQYEQTRHNAGFWFLDEVASRCGGRFSADSRSQGMLAKLDLAGESLLLLKPMQYMNRSGGSVSAMAHFFKIDPEQILVAHDELDFAPGTVRLKLGGGHGGHNGLRDIVAKLGSPAFARIRIGIGHPGHRDDVVNYVLDRPSRHDGDLIRSAIERAAAYLPDMVDGRLDAVMNGLHV
jgi:peptidyl-tRNA hydrolase, PTH1 family